MDLIFHILHDNKIDLGEVICQNIFRVPEQNTRSHPYLCMITALCQRVGVVALGSDSTHRPGRVMGDSAIQKYRSDLGHRHAPVELASNGDDDKTPYLDAPTPIVPAPAAVAPPNQKF